MDTSRYKALFVAEARELLAELADGLEKLPTEAETDTFSALLRSAHSLKGMAATMGYEGVTQVSHACEDFFTLARDKRIPLSDQVREALLEAVDFLSSQVDLVESDAEMCSGEELTAKLRLLFEAGPEPAADPAAGPPSAESPIAAVPPCVTPAEDTPEQALPAKAKRVRVSARISSQVPLPGARAMVLLGEAGRLGQDLQSTPPASELGRGSFDGRISLRFSTELSHDELRTRLGSVPDVESLEIGDQGAPGSTEATADSAGDQPAAVAQSVRVGTDQMDRLLEGVAELVVGVSTLERDLSGHQQARHGLERLQGQLGRLRQDVLGMRMLPFQTIVPQLQRAVRELSRQLGKPVRLELRGTETRLDRVIIEELLSPLVHLLRNALDHAIESVEERRGLGKPDEGLLKLEVDRQGDGVLVRIADDGRGLDTDRLVERALAQGLLSPEQAVRMSHADRLRLATLPGVSTATEVSDISGRGVGLDLVQDRVEGLGGRFLIESEPGSGTSFTLRVPLTLAMQRTLLLRTEGQSFSVPVARVHAVAEIEPTQVEGPKTAPWVQLGDPAEEPPVHLFRLADLLGLGRTQATAGPFQALLFNAGDRRYGMIIDQMLGDREVVVRPLGRPLQHMPHYTGVAVLAEGELALVLDLDGLTSLAEAA